MSGVASPDAPYVVHQSPSPHHGHHHHHQHGAAVDPPPPHHQGGASSSARMVMHPPQGSSSSSQLPPGAYAVRPSLATAIHRHYDRAKAFADVQHQHQQQQQHAEPSAAAAAGAPRTAVDVALFSTHPGPHPGDVAGGSASPYYSTSRQHRGGLSTSPRDDHHARVAADEEGAGYAGGGSGGDGVVQPPWAGMPGLHPPPGSSASPSRRVVADGGDGVEMDRQGLLPTGSPDPAVAGSSAALYRGGAYVAPSPVRYYAFAGDMPLPAQYHWAALDLPPSSAVPASAEPLNTLLHGSGDQALAVRVRAAARQLGHKLAGKREPAPQMFNLRAVRNTWPQLVGTFVLSFVAMLLVSALHYHVFLEQYKLQFFVAPFGATAAIIFSLTDSDSAQPRNVFLGHMLCAGVGVSARHIFAQHGTDAFMVAGPLALAISVTCMQAFNVMHPPGCATVLLAVYAPDSGVAWDGYFFLVLPILTGVLVLLAVGWLGNNVVPGRHYPTYW